MPLHLTVAVIALGSFACSGGEATPADAGIAAEVEHQAPSHQEHFAAAPSPEHGQVHHQYNQDNAYHVHIVPPAPASEPMLFGTGAAEGADGTLYLYDPYCRLPDDGSTCPDGYGVCAWASRCSTYDAETGFDCPGCGHLEILALDEVADPCGLWYWDKSAGDTWRLRARDSFIVVNEITEEIAIGEGATGFGFESCRQRCRDDDACVGGMTYSPGDDPEWTTRCVLLHPSAQPLAPVGEVPFPLTFHPDAVNEAISMFTPAGTLHSSLFSKCRDHEDDLEQLGIAAP